MTGEVHGGPSWSSWDEALQRLEEFVDDYPVDRALPNLRTIVERAALPPEFIREDDRAHKVLHEAMSARPLSRIEQVAQLRTEVELLTLEVQVIIDRLGTDLDAEEERNAAHRLGAVRARLSQIRRRI